MGRSELAVPSIATQAPSDLTDANLKKLSGRTCCFARWTRLRRSRRSSSRDGRRMREIVERLVSLQTGRRLMRDQPRPHGVDRDARASHVHARRSLRSASCSSRPTRSSRSGDPRATSLLVAAAIAVAAATVLVSAGAAVVSPGVRTTPLATPAATSPTTPASTTPSLVVTGVPLAGPSDTTGGEEMRRDARRRGQLACCERLTSPACARSPLAVVQGVGHGHDPRAPGHYSFDTG